MDKSPTEKVNILMVDDQPSKLLGYRVILEELGENLIPAGSATEALDQLLKHDAAVVLIDVCMPELDGFELAAIIRGHPRFQRTAIIFVSGVHLTDLDRLKGYGLGAVDYVPVPVVPEILRAKVSVFLQLYRTTRQLEELNRELEERVRERTSELERTAAALRDADRRKDEFLAMLAHELRNPLAPIRTAAELLRLPGVPEARRATSRDIIERQVDHLVRLIDDLLDVSRVERGLITLQRKPVDLAEIVTRAVETSRPAMDRRHHTLDVQLPPQGVVVDGDEIRLIQILGNVLNNAAKFTDPGGSIAVDVSVENGDVALRVTDTGIGIPAELLPNIFELFTQGDRGVERAAGGLGIGLALVRKLVEMHDGTVSARSDGPGHGSEITIRLPVLVDAVSQVPPGRARVPLSAAAGHRVLVVDDNRDAAEAMTMLLESAGFSIRTAHDGADGFEQAAAFHPEIVLLDLGIPRMSGYDLARRLREQPWGRDILLVAVTGWGQKEDRERTARAGFDAHLVKPVGEQDLLDAIAGGGRVVRPSL